MKDMETIFAQLKAKIPHLPEPEKKELLQFIRRQVEFLESHSMAPRLNNSARKNQDAWTMLGKIQKEWLNGFKTIQHLLEGSN